MDDVAQGRVRKGVQSKAFKILREHLPNDWFDLLKRRALLLTPEIPPLLSSQVNDLRSSLLKYGKTHGLANAFYVIKTLTNGWLTSSRLQEVPVLPCIFGCIDERDDLVHYVSCSPLWTLVGECGVLPHPPARRSSSDRRSLTSPTFDNFRLCGIACWLYHALKIGERTRIDDLIDQGDPEGVWTLSRELLVECPLRVETT